MATEQEIQAAITKANLGGERAENAASAANTEAAKATQSANRANSIADQCAEQVNRAKAIEDAFNNAIVNKVGVLPTYPIEQPVENTTAINARDQFAKDKEKDDKIKANQDKIVQLEQKVNTADSLLKDVSEFVDAKFEHDESTNFINKNKLTNKYYVNGGENGELKYYNDDTFFATDYLSIKPNTQYYKAGVYNGYYAFYDDAKKYISGGGFGAAIGSPFTTPSNAHYARFTIVGDTSNSWIFTSNAKPADYCDKLTNTNVYLKHDSVSSDNITDLSVITDKIADESVTPQKIAKVHDNATNYISGWTSNSYIDATGAQKPTSGLTASDKIYLSENKSYYWKSFINGYYAFYRNDNSVIAAYPNNSKTLTNPFTPPSGTAYMRVTSYGNTDDCWINTINLKPLKYNNIIDPDIIGYNKGVNCEYIGNEISVFNKILCIGDSLTAGVFNYLVNGAATGNIALPNYSYPTYLNKISGVNTTNKGIGGNTSFEWYANQSSIDMSGHDAAIIQMGVNDAIRNMSDYGTAWNARSDQGFINIIDKLKRENKGIKIYVATIIPAQSYSSTQYVQASEAIRSIVNTINDKDVILIDMAIHGNTAKSDAYNNGHLSALGYYRLAMDYKALISYHISNNMDMYREVQFAGTDYKYLP